MSDRPKDFMHVMEIAAAKALAFLGLEREGWDSSDYLDATLSSSAALMDQVIVDLLRRGESANWEEAYRLVVEAVTAGLLYNRPAMERDAYGRR